jgi:hypothetical protein
MNEVDLVRDFYVPEEKEALYTQVPIPEGEVQEALEELGNEEEEVEEGKEGGQVAEKKGMFLSASEI